MLPDETPMHLYCIRRSGATTPWGVGPPHEPDPLCGCSDMRLPDRRCGRRGDSLTPLHDKRGETTLLITRSLDPVGLSLERVSIEERTIVL